MLEILFAPVCRLWTELTSAGSLLMLASDAEILPVGDFDLPIALEEGELTLRFQFSGAINGKKLFRAVRATTGRPEDHASPVPRLMLSGPRLEGFGSHA